MNNLEDFLYLSRENFLECNWPNDNPESDHQSNSSISKSLQDTAKNLLEVGKPDCHKILELLSRILFMRLVPDNLSEPFQPEFEDFQRGKRSMIPEDLREQELSFFEQILDDINLPNLKARIADLLWLLLLSPRKVEYAKTAIDAYLVHDIDGESWQRGVKSSLERATRLAIQIKDWDRLEKIKNLLFSAFLKEYSESKYMQLWLAESLDELKIDHSFRPHIAQNLYEKANELKAQNEFHSSILYFKLSAKKNLQCNERDKYLESLIGIAECYLDEADMRSSSSNMVANGFYENAIQAYREVPVKERDRYDIENKIKEVRLKIISSGKASLEEMVPLASPSLDVSEIVELSINHVKDKSNLHEALLHFIGVVHPLKYDELLKTSQESLNSSLFTSLFSGRHLSEHGNVIAKTPSMNLNAGMDDPDNQAVLHKQMQSQFSIIVDLAVQYQILPALRQLNTEHRFTKKIIIAICNQSPIVQEDRSYLLGKALWLGFEEDFGLAIHLLCPQIEHLVRTKLKEEQVITTHLDKNGIETEYGLNTLMELPEAEQIFGKSLCFELKSIFTEALGHNLRNKVAHGLLDDNNSISIGSIYAWWMILRLVITAIVSGQIKSD